MISAFPDLYFCKNKTALQAADHPDIRFMTVQTLPFYTIIKINKSSSVPVFQQLANGVEQLIITGTIKPGYRLPSGREMARIMKLNRSTVVAAYGELNARGWIDIALRKGVRVVEQLPALQARQLNRQAAGIEKKRIQTGFYQKLAAALPGEPQAKPFFKLLVDDGYPDARIAPLNTLISRYKFLLNKPSKLTSIINERPAGAAALRQELSSFLSKTRGMQVTPDHILTTRGAQGAIYMAAQMIVKPGSKVIVGSLSYAMANKVFEHLGAKLIKVGVDEQGIDVDAIESICKISPPDLLYIIPHHHHPTTVTLSAERRVRLLNIIETYQLPLIEDDYDYDFHYENNPVLPLASTNPQGLILYIGSVSKTLALTVRSGYLVADPGFVMQAGKLKALMEIRGDLLMEEAIAYLFQTGDMQRHIARSVKLYKERRDIFCELLTHDLPHMLHFRKPAGGMAVWSEFLAGFPLPRIAAQLAKDHIYMSDGSNYNQGDPSVNGVRLGFASMNESEMKSLVHALRKAGGL